MNLICLVREICRLDDARSKFVSDELDKRFPGQLVVPCSAFIDLPPAPQKQELRDLLHAQSPATLYMLVTLWRLGRGDFSAGCDLLNEYMEVADGFANIRETVNYLIGKQLASYFEKALHRLKENAVDVDGLLK